MNTKIEWAELTINPIQDKRKGKSGRGYHCTKCQPECLHCYAETLNNRFGNHHPFDDAPVEFEIVWNVIDKLAKRRKPAVVFVESMGDMFHWGVETAQIFSILDALRKIDQHRYIFLTKRAVRMSILSISYCENHNLSALPDNWIGMVTAGTQATIDKNVPPLLASKFQVRGVSCEPLLESVSFDAYRGLSVYLNWIVVGAETGPGKRLMKIDWARNIRNQCAQWGTSFFFKKNSAGERMLDGRLWEQLPA